MNRYIKTICMAIVLIFANSVYAEYYVHRLPYGAQIAGDDPWVIGIALSNYTSEKLRIGAEYWDEEGELICEKSYLIEPNGIAAFILPDVYRYQAVYWATGDFGVSMVLGNRTFSWKLDSFPMAYSPALNENNSVAICSVSDTYYMTIKGGPRCLPERAATALRDVFRWYFLEAGS